MVTVVSALEQTIDATEKALINAGFIDGSTLKASEIKVESNPLFWFMKVTSKDASDKPLYATYEVSDLGALAHGDGQPSVRRARIQLNIYSRDKKIFTLLNATNNSFLVTFGNFELRQVVYDTSLLAYNFSFIASANITDLPVEE